MAAAVEHSKRLERVSDEIAWDLLRDEWELLMAVGSGPTTGDVAAERVAEPVDAVTPRLELLVEHGLLRRSGTDGYTLVTADHQRQEGMSSYVRDLILRRIQLGGPPPLHAQVRFDVGAHADLGAIVARAETELFPAVAERASQPETDRSERFLLVLALSTDCARPDTDVVDDHGMMHGSELVPHVLRVVRSAAVERARSETTETAKLWVAEMRVDPEIADQIIDQVEQFIRTVPGVSGTGAAAFGVWPVATRPGALSGEEE